MKEEKDIQPIDKLFRQSLEGYSPAPPASVWKGIKGRKIGRNLSSGKWFTSPGGLSVISAVVLVASSWIIYKTFLAELKLTPQSSKVPNVIIDSAVSGKMKSEVSETYNPQPKEDLQVNSASANDNQSGNRPDIKSTAGTTANNGQTLGNQAETGINQNTTKTAGKIKADPLNSPEYKPVKTKSKTGKSQKIENKASDKSNIEALKSTVNVSVVKPGNTAESKANANAAEPIVSGYENNAKNKDISLPPPLTLAEIAAGDVSKPPVTNSDLPGNDTVNSNISKPDSNSAGSPDRGNNKGPENTKTGIFNDLVWQIGIGGNVGQVYQKDRNANFFYGGLITGGLWHTKWKAGIETGIGLSKNKDYGSVENSWMTSDSIIVTDTIWHQQDSLIYFELIDSTIYFPVAHSDTLNYSYSYTYMQIPFFITKQLATFGKFSLDIKAGPVVGFMISKKESVTGSMPPDNVIVTVVNKNYTRLDVSWQLHIAPQLRWDITDKLSIGISPMAVMYLNDLYDKKNRPSSKPYGLSIYGGVTYKFK